jgi:hypothetical protein
MPQRLLLVLTACALLAGCRIAPSKYFETDGEGWLILFNGKDLNGWNDPKNYWKVEDGAIAFSGPLDDKHREESYLLTKERFSDFIYEVEFKIQPRGNSGVYFRVDKPAEPMHTGFEIQVANHHGRPVTKNTCGGIYDCVAPTKNMAKPAGEWNQVRITCLDNRIQIELNGERTVDCDLNQWTEAGQNPDGTKNKFRLAYKDMAREGHLGFQDHGLPVWFRNIRLKPLD